MKKFVSVFLAVAMMLSVAALFGGCGGGDFPVSVANIKIEKEPERVIVLDASTAEIMNYMGYTRKIAGRSESVNQAELAAAQVVGGKVTPNIDIIEKLQADLVFCDTTLSEGSKESLAKKGIPVVTLQQPNTEIEVKTNYETIGKVLGGAKSGAQEGKAAYDKLVSELEKLKRDVEGLSGTGALNTVCYLYLGSGNKLSKLSSDSYGNVLLDYTNCVNIFSAGGSDAILTDISKIVSGANPSFIFYNDEATLKVIKKDAALSKIAAVKGNKMMQVPLSCFTRPGETAKKTVAAMNDFIYKGKTTDLKESVPEPTQAASQAATQTASRTAAQQTTQAAQNVSAQYKITLDGLALKQNDDNDNVKIMQQRLFDLGYIKKEGDDTNITGFFGEVTKTAVKTFQKNNGLSETGEADNATLKAMFDAAAKKAG